MSKYKLVNPPNVGSMIVIKPEGKGSVPMELRGMYTTRTEAQRAVDTYEEALAYIKEELAVAKEAVKAIKKAEANKKVKAKKE